MLFYGSASFVVLQLSDILVSQLALPSWVFPSVLILLLAGLPMVVGTALVHGVHRATADREIARAGEPEAGAESPPEEAGGDDDGPGIRVPALLRGLTWRRTLLAGGATFALLFVAISGYAASRATGVGPWGTLFGKGMLSDQEALVLAEFEARGTDPDLGRTVTEALRVDLSQAPSLRLLEGEEVREVLGRMGRAPHEPLTGELARELASREGLKATVTGEVAAAGSGFHLLARVVAAEDGATLVAVRETARSEADFLDAVDRLSHSLRERVGEPLRSLAARPPLTRITTSSLEALQLYARSHSAPDPARAVPLLQEAVRLDSTFVWAWNLLAHALESAGAPTSTVRDAFLRGREHLDRLPGVERYVAMSVYQVQVDGDYEGRVRTLETAFDLFPDHPEVRRALANALTTTGRPERAAEILEPLVTGRAVSFSALRILVRALVQQGMPDSALVVLDRYGEGAHAEPWFLGRRMWAAGAARDYEAAEDAARQLAAMDAGPGRRADAVGVLAAVAAQRGRDQEADRYMAVVGEAARELVLLPEGRVPDVLLFWQAARFAIRDEDPGALRQWIREVTPPVPGDAASALDYPYVHLAYSWAFAGEAERTRALLDDARRRWPPGLLARLEGLLQLTEGLLALQERRLDDAETVLRAHRLCERCFLPLAARAREAAGDRERALELWDLYDRSRSMDAVYSDALWIPELYEARARLKEELGDREGAARELRLALAAFRDPDPVHASRLEGWRRDLRRLQ